MKKCLGLFLVLSVLILVSRPTPWLSVSGQNARIIEKTFNERLAVQLPKSMKIAQDYFEPGGQLAAGLNFHDEELLFRGYIQLWRLDDLEKFLTSSKNVSTFDFNAYSLKSITYAGLNGLLNEWNAAFGDLYTISAKEYWLKKSDNDGKADKAGNSEVLRISFYVDTQSFTDAQVQQIHNILSSLRWD
ncbi:hypothetical protein [Paradesulfitobacterium ferrireducens]|uniref:hypothetical protein n=1 Tax=Paradesulfitobacterium ferrireducens TaxID=2816476 RepID=UPI001A8F4732|nr:hypothetical protein [Paradesulfitobacterium ferrireducens]